MLISGQLYKKGSDQVLRICINPDEYEMIMQNAHIRIGGIHLSSQQTAHRVMREGFWWPVMYSCAEEFIRHCPQCQAHRPVPYTTLYSISHRPHWSSYIVKYLQKGHTEPDLPRHRKKTIEVEVANYTLISEQLYKRSRDNNLRLCVNERKYLDVLHQAHSGVAGGHFFGETTAEKILWSGLWWPTLFSDALEFVKRCDVCQRTKLPIASDRMPLRPIMAARAFAKWGIDFVGPIKPPALCTHAEYIIVATYYLTKWVEVKATVRNDTRTTAKFLYENIFIRFGLPVEIVSDQGVYFINKIIEFLLEEFMVVQKRSAPYHAQANGQAESSNKTLSTALTTIVSESQTDWEQKLSYVLWAYQTAYKIMVGTTPFDLVYGINAILPMEFLLPTLRVAKELEWTGHDLSKRVEQLEQLDETRLLAVVGMYAEKRRRKYWHDQYVKTNRFRQGDLILLYTLKKHKRKLKQRGVGPFVVSELNTSGTMRLETLDGVPMGNFRSSRHVR